MTAADDREQARADDDARWRRLAETLEQLLDSDPQAREAELARLPSWLASEARAALAAISEADDFDDLAMATTGPATSDADAEAKAEALIGRRVGGFELQGLLGQGGMAFVYLAEREQGGARQRVALKWLRPDRVSTPLRQRFLAEQRIVARLEHPGIARLIAAGVDDGVPWLATELIEGEPLLAWCDARRLPTGARIDCFVRVCEAVDAAHRALIVHRDLKPGNILVDADGEPRLLDFGISRLLDSDDDAARTRAEWRLLTPEYA